MVDKIFPTQYTGTAPPVASRTASLLANDGSSSGAVSVASVLSLLASSDITAGGGLLSTNAAATYAPLASPVFTGAPVAPTPTTSDNSTKLATSAFVKAQNYSSLASPTFSGTPTSPTATAGTSSSQIATTAFVSNAISNRCSTYKILATGATPQWVILGTFNAAQAGDLCRVKIVATTNYNGDAANLQTSEVIFSTSNGTDTNAAGFAGACTWYKHGENTNAPSAIKWVANASGNAATSFNLLASFGVSTGNNSYYEVTTGNGTWTNINTGGQTDPGGNSGLVNVPTEEYYSTSQNTFTSDANFFGNVILGNDTITGSRVLYMDGAVGSDKLLILRSAGNNRWIIQSDASAESGSNVGCDFYISNFDDAGNFIDNPFQIQRSTGHTTISHLFAGDGALYGVQLYNSIMNNYAIGNVTPSTARFTTLSASDIFTTTSGEIKNVRVVTAAGTVAVGFTDRFVVINKTTGAATTVTLPASPPVGTMFTIKDGKGDSVTNHITITPAAGNIDGSTTLVISTAYQARTLIYNGTTWSTV